nr:hypothetical protein [uncultured Psychroserpens sp.]
MANSSLGPIPKLARSKIRIQVSSPSQENIPVSIGVLPTLCVKVICAFDLKIQQMEIMTINLNFKFLFIFQLVANVFVCGLLRWLELS